MQLQGAKTPIGPAVPQSSHTKPLAGPLLVAWRVARGKSAAWPVAYPDGRGRIPDLKTQVIPGGPLHPTASYPTEAPHASRSGNLALVVREVVLRWGLQRAGCDELEYASCARLGSWHS